MTVSAKRQEKASFSRPAVSPRRERMNRIMTLLEFVGSMG